MSSVPAALAGQVVESGPERRHHELVWTVRLPDGRRAQLAQLAAELAAEPALRHRFVHEIERLAAVRTPALAETLAIGPAPDPRDPAAEPPWRLRVEPQGRHLADWLGVEGTQRPIDEVVDVIASLADALAAIHSAGVVLRDLEPRGATLTEGGIVVSEGGLARLGILSSRTASTLALEASPWAAPEHLRSTLVDARADVYTLGVFLHRALTGVLPATPGLLGKRAPLVSLVSLRSSIPAPLDALTRRCLSISVDERPASAREVGEALRGRGGGELVVARAACQACGAEARVGLRLCLACGREAVQVKAGGGDHAVLLRKMIDEAEPLASLRDFFATFGSEVPALNFLIGDQRLYAKEEIKRLHKLPAPLFTELDEKDATALAARLTGKYKGMEIAVVDNRQRRRRARAGLGIAVGGAALFAGSLVALISGVDAALATMFVGLFGGLGGVILRTANRGWDRTGLAALRPAAAALPAGNPLIARIAALIAGKPAADVKERLAEIALWLQRIADARGGEASLEIGLWLEPLERLVDAVDRQVTALAALDRELASLDEGTIVRALAASEARGEPATRRRELLAGLDRLRGLEDQRTAGLGRLLEAGALLRRMAERVLAERAEQASYEAELARARAVLDE